MDLHLRERIMTVREAALASGAGIKDAAVVSIMAPLARGMSSGFALGAGRRAVADAIKAATAAGKTDETVALSGISLAMADQLARQPSPTILDLLAENAWRMDALKALPGDTDYGDTGTTVADQLAAATARRQELKAAVKPSESITAWLHDASEGEVASYVDTWILHGELEALKTAFPAKAE